MKKISTILSVLFIGGSLMAQSPLKKDKSYEFVDATQQAPSADMPKRIVTKEKSGAGCGTLIYGFDFATGIPAGWSNYGSSSGALWEYRGPSTTPDVNVGSRGAYASGDPIVSTTASNGFMIFDSDYLDNNGTAGAFGTGAAPTPHRGYLATSPLDFTNYSDVTMTLESFARTFFGQSWINFSYDGGNTWSDSLQLHDDLAVNAASDNSVTYSLNIGQFVGGKNNVVVGFYYNGFPGNANGNGYYFWAFDDVAFLETPDWNLSLSDWGWSQGDRLGNYGITPLNEVQANSAVALVENKGKSASSNASLSIVTSDNSGVVNNATLPLGTMASASDSIVEEATGFTPSDTGLYIVNMSVDQDSADCDPTDNDDIYGYIVSENGGRYAADHAAITGQISAFLGTNSFNGAEDGFMMLNLFEFDNSYDLNTLWMNVSALTSEGAQARVVIFDTLGLATGLGAGGGLTNQGNPVFEGPFYDFDGTEGDSGEVYLQVGTTLQPGAYFIGIECFTTGGIDTVRISYEDVFGIHDPAASLIYLAAGSSPGLYTNPDGVYLMRLNQSNCSGVAFTITGNVDDTQEIGSITNVQIAGGKGPYNVSWSGPNLFTSTSLNLNTITEQGTYTLSVYDKNGCVGTQDFTVAGVVSAETIDAKVEMDVYPNPSNGVFNLKFNNIKAGSYNVEVRNMMGQVVYNNSINLNANGNNLLDLSTLDKGAYILNISGASVELNENVIIK